VPLVRIEAVGPQMRARTWAQRRRMIAELLAGQVLRRRQRQVKGPMSLRIVVLVQRIGWAVLAVGQLPVPVLRKRARRRKRQIQTNIEEPLEQCSLVEEEPEVALPIRKQAQVVEELLAPSKPLELTYFYLDNKFSFLLYNLKKMLSLTRKQVPCRTEQPARTMWGRERVREPSSSRTRKTELKEANRKRWDPVASRRERRVPIEDKPLEFRKLMVE